MRGCLLVALLAACGSTAAGGGGGGDDGTTDSNTGSNGGGNGTNVFAPTTTKVVIEIDYETGQAPYTGTTVTFGDTWQISQTNLDRLFAGHKQITLPKTLPEMTDIGNVADEEITVADLAALSSAHRTKHDTADTKTYWMIFVSGHFADDTGVKTGVLGVSVGDTVVMFKDVIKSTADIGNPNTVRFVEQSTIVHELAHSIGLVQNGIPMIGDHLDEAHGAHCTNSDCVMYWLNEGATAARDYALQKILTGSTILFDDACLADIDAQTGGL
jgi:hypothetical protein